jgi:hypothetical protein
VSGVMAGTIGIVAEIREERAILYTQSNTTFIAIKPIFNRSPL